MVEILFFFAVFFLFPIITDIEYNYYENHQTLLFIKQVPARLVWGVFGIVPYLFYYRLVIPYSLFRQRYWLFAAMLAGFLVLLNLYYIYVSGWLLSRLTFVPEHVLKEAVRSSSRSPFKLNFSVIYIFRELLMFTALAYFIRSSRQEKQVQELKQQQLQSELDYLKMQLQPHFFFNTLNNIYSLALKRSVKTAPLVAKHAGMMRYILYDSTGKLVSLDQEITFLENYTLVEAARFSEKIRIEFETQGIKPGMVIEPLLLLPFIENAFKHGIREELHSGFVHVLICVINNELTLEVRNSKPEMQGEVVPTQGIGLANAERLSILYPGMHSLEIKEETETYEVLLTLTLHAS